LTNLRHKYKTQYLTGRLGRPMYKITPSSWATDYSSNGSGTTTSNADGNGGNETTEDGSGSTTADSSEAEGLQHHAFYS
jgi:hypothetical protein